MTTEATVLRDVLVLTPNRFDDNRVVFVESRGQRTLLAAGTDLQGFAKFDSPFSNENKT